MPDTLTSPEHNTPKAQKQKLLSVESISSQNIRKTGHLRAFELRTAILGTIHKHDARSANALASGKTGHLRFEHDPKRNQRSSGSPNRALLWFRLPCRHDNRHQGLLPAIHSPASGNEALVQRFLDTRTNPLLY